VEEVLIHLAGALALHHLALLPGVADLHGEPGEGRAGRQGDAEPALDHLVARVLERQAQLGESEGRLEQAVRLQRDQSEARAIRSRELDRGTRLGLLRIVLDLRKPERGRSEVGRGDVGLGDDRARRARRETRGQTQGDEDEKAEQRGGAEHGLPPPDRSGRSRSWDPMST
jgi:hypothetical protein